MGIAVAKASARDVDASIPCLAEREEENHETNVQQQQTASAQDSKNDGKAAKDFERRQCHGNDGDIGIVDEVETADVIGKRHGADAENFHEAGPNEEPPKREVQ